VKKQSQLGTSTHSDGMVNLAYRTGFIPSRRGGSGSGNKKRQNKATAPCARNAVIGGLVKMGERNQGQKGGVESLGSGTRARICAANGCFGPGLMIS
jgi:hypothetical protein